MLTLALHNNAAKNLYTASAFEESAFQITVRNEVGKPVPRTAVGERILTPPMVVGANSIAAFSPGQTLIYRFNLARLFDLSRAGVYTVTVNRRFSPWTLPRPAVDTPVQEIVLSAGPLTIQMEEDATAKSSPIPFIAPPSRQPFLYMTSSYGNGVGRYRVDQNGGVSFAFSPAPAAPAPSAKEGFHSITTTPDGRFLYVSNGGDNTVSQFQIGDDGLLLPLSPPTVPAHPFPSYPSSLLMDPKGRFLYNLSGTLYAIGTDGRLTVIASVSNDPPAKNHDPKITAYDYNVIASETGAINAAGTFLYTSLGQTRSYRIAHDGKLTALPPVGLASEKNQASDMAIVLSPSGKFAYVGISTTLSNAFFDQIVPMRVAPDGTLSALPGVITPKGPPPEWPGYTLPDCIALLAEPSGRFLIVVNPKYLACYRIGLDGSLTPFGAMPTGADFTSAFFGPGGKILYALNRSPSPLVAFRLDDQLGLTPAGVNLPNSLLSNRAKIIRYFTFG